MSKRTVTGIIALIIMISTVACMANIENIAEVFVPTAEESASESKNDIMLMSDTASADGQLTDIGYMENHYKTMMSSAYVKRSADGESVDPQSGILTLNQTDYSIPLTSNTFEIRRIFRSNLAGGEYGFYDGGNSFGENDSFYKDKYHLGEGWRFSFPMLEITREPECSDNGGTDILNIMYHSESGEVYSITPIVEGSEEANDRRVTDFSIGNHALKDIDITFNTEEGNAHKTRLKSIDIKNRKQGVTYRFGAYGYLDEIIYSNAEHRDETKSDRISFKYDNIDIYTDEATKYEKSGIDMGSREIWYESQYGLSSITVKTREEADKTIRIHYSNKTVSRLELPNGKNIRYKYDNKNKVLESVTDTDGKAKYKFDMESVDVKRTSYHANPKNITMYKMTNILYCRENRISHYDYIVTNDAISDWGYANVQTHQDYECINSDALNETAILGCNVKKIGAETKYTYPTGDEVYITDGLYTEKFDVLNEDFWERNRNTGNECGTFNFTNRSMRSWLRMHSEILSKEKYGNF